MIITPDMYEPYFGKVTEECVKIFDKGENIEPFELLTRLMSLDGMPMHCPVHHYIMPAALLTACRQRQGCDMEILGRDLGEAEKRARNILPGFCGLYGACGAAVGTGIFFSIITGTTPYTSDAPWGWANQATGRALLDIAALGGPRCCKRTCYTAFKSVLPQIKEALGFDIELPGIIRCTQHQNSEECLLADCPYYIETLNTADVICGALCTDGA